MLVMKWRNWTTHTFPVEMQNSTTSLKNSLAISYKTKNSTTLESSIHTLGHLFQINEMYEHTNTYPWKFINALFVIAKSWTHPDVLHRWMVEQIMVYTYHAILFRSKTNELLTDAVIWMNIKGIMLSAKSQFRCIKMNSTFFFLKKNSSTLLPKLCLLEL